MLNFLLITIGIYYSSVKPIKSTPILSPRDPFALKDHSHMWQSRLANNPG